MPDSPDPIDLAIGARIRIRRKERGVTQQDLAAILGVSFQQVQKYERGASRLVASSLVRLARALDLTIGELVGETPDDGETQDVLSRLVTPGAPAMLTAYARLASAAQRRAVLQLLESMTVEAHT